MEQTVDRIANILLREHGYFPHCEGVGTFFGMRVNKHAMPL